MGNTAASPVGSFTIPLPAVAETRLNPTLDADRVAVVELQIDRVKDPVTGLDVPVPGGIGSFSAVLRFDPSCMTIVDVRDVPEFQGFTNFSISPLDTLRINGFTPALTGPATPTTLAKVVVRLIGSANVPCDLTWESALLGAADTGEEFTQEGPQTDSYRRGDVNQNGTVNIVDAQFVAQCDVGNREFGLALNQCHPINSASVRHDGSAGDVPNIIDAQFIANFDILLRDEFFNINLPP